MFTGIVEEMGEVVEITGDQESARLVVRGRVVPADARPGDSIAVNGVCLTVVEITGEVFAADMMAETLKRSSLGVVYPGEKVNLERAAALGSRLGGHLVQGHVDGVSTLLARRAGRDWTAVRFSLTPGLSRYVAEKGSIAVDGVSLTVVQVAVDWFEVGLVPTTLKLTTLGHKGVGDPVNVEVDLIAKYVERLLVDGGRP